MKRTYSSMQLSPHRKGVAGHAAF